MMRLCGICCAMVALMPMAADASEIYRCGEPKGVRIDSSSDLKPSADGFEGVFPVVIIEGDAMTVVWGNSKSAGGPENAWKPVVFYRDDSTVSAATYDSGPSASSSMLFTIDRKRGIIYLTQHKNLDAFDASAASTVAAVCTKK